MTHTLTITCFAAKFRPLLRQLGLYTTSLVAWKNVFPRKHAGRSQVRASKAFSHWWEANLVVRLAIIFTEKQYKKAQLSLTNPRDAKACQNCSNSTCLQRCRWQYWPIFKRLTAIASEIREIPRNSLKIQTYGVQGHPRSSILVSIESPYVTCC